MPDEIELKAEGGRVRAELAGERVSGLAINMRRLQIAPGVLVECGGIGGVRTAPEHRGRGYSSKVMAESMAHQRRLGKHVSGLYTGARIVAHRLYRNFGFADVAELTERVKYLDFTAYVRRLAGRRVRVRPAEAGRGAKLGTSSHLRRALAWAESPKSRLSAAAGLTGSLELDVTGAGTVTLLCADGRVEVSQGAEASAGLAVRMTSGVFGSLAELAVSFDEALGLGLVEIVRGAEEDVVRAAGVLFGPWESPMEGARR